MYIFLVVYLCPLLSYSQTCVGEINTPLGSTIGIWDWTAEEEFEVHIKSSETGGLTITQLADSPFFLTFNGQPNTSHLGDSDEKDFLPEDGWELILKDFGTAAQGVSIPIFILYNRFSGKLRAFHYLVNPDDINVLITSISHYKSLSFSHVNASLESTFTPMDAIENYSDKEIFIESPNLFADNGGLWLMADIPTTYDPCTCLNKSGLLLRNWAKDLSTFTLTLEGSGSIDQIISNGSASQSTLSVKNVNVNNILAGIKKGTEAYKSISGMVGKTNEQTASWLKTNASDNIIAQLATNGISEITADNVNNALDLIGGFTDSASRKLHGQAKKGGLSKFIPDELKAVIPYAGAIGGFLDFFVSKSSQPQPMRFENNMSFNGTGEISDPYTS